jgi:hypothetical protein
MNALDLPPRRPLPRETRDRIRRSIDAGMADRPRRSRAPLAAAAAVAVLAMSAVAVIRWAPGPPTRHPAAPASTASPSPAQRVTMTSPDTRTHEDLDRCAAAIAASPRAEEFPPRAEWRPEFTATAPDGARVTAFVSQGGKPAFCEVTATTATVSEPNPEFAPMAVTPEHPSAASVFGLYLSPTGVLAGVATGVDALEFSVVRETRRALKPFPVGVPALRDGLFVVNLGDCGDGEYVDVVGRNSQGMAVVTGMVSCLAFPPAGATGPVG